MFFIDTKIVEKIQKLLSLSESSNEHEAKLAMLKAQEFLVKHKLSVKEVKQFKTFNSPIKKNVTKVTFKKAKWKAELAELIADNFGCYCYFNTKRTHTIVFLGREEDIEVCNIVFSYAVDCIYSAVKKMRYQYMRNGYSTKGLENDYAMGFIAGLRKKFKEQKENNQEWGLVLVKDEEVTEAYRQINFKRTINTDIYLERFAEVYEQGHEDGSKFSITDKIAEVQ